MAASDVGIPQDGGATNVKLHPYLITLVRWCVSCLWSTATVLLHRLVTTPLPSITAGSKQAGRSGRAAPKSRRAGTEHLHPEPLVECVELHAPDAPTIDVIFVHGLYGSLGNTWRQGEWQTKYKSDPIIVPLRNHPTETCSCYQDTPEPSYSNVQQMYAYETNLNESNLNEKVTFNQISGCFKKILPNENSLITEQFYNNTLIDVNVDNYETQAQFVTELFKNDCDKNCDLNTFKKCKYEDNLVQCNCDETNNSNCNSEQCKLNEKCKSNECKCKLNVSKCESGCGCVCDECYSSCWPRDWIREDFPGARVISVNYTSDPYLWRPLWVKGNKRLQLHERAEQMTQQLLQLGVGGRPVVWVGHSKGGLFIKQIYCEAYEAHLKLDKNTLKQPSIINNSTDESQRKYNNDTVINNIDNKFNSFNDIEAHNTNRGHGEENTNNLLHSFINEHRKDVSSIEHCENTLRSIDAMNEIRNNNNSGHIYLNSDENKQDFDKNFNTIHNNDAVTEIDEEDDVLHSGAAESDENTAFIDISVRENGKVRHSDSATDADDTDHATTAMDVLSSNDEEDSARARARARLWAASRGFMFYSVPHRGSPLADIKTPITSRSVELQEIAKDCPLVLDLQRRWMTATRAARSQGGADGARSEGGADGARSEGGADGARSEGGADGARSEGGADGARGAGPRVRSLVETGRTLMSVLWLRIVSEDSADAGVGSLRGVSVDHREICKPAGRRCPLYTELADLVRAAAAPCRCRDRDQHDHYSNTLL